MSTAIKFAIEPRDVISPIKSEDDSRIVKDCLSGSEEAWTALIEKYKRLIFSIPVKYGLDREQAADIFQSVCLELFCELRNVRSVESLRSWLISVTAHKCLHSKKQRSNQIDLEDLDESNIKAGTISAAVLLEQVEAEQKLREVVAESSPRCRELIRMLFYEEPALPYAEIAQKLGLSTGSIGFIRGRCLEKLEKSLTVIGF
jgi:RNA polymerase sigma factor (sigma-70 family)